VQDLDEFYLRMHFRKLAILRSKVFEFDVIWMVWFVNGDTTCDI